MDKIFWIESVLSNDEVSSDQELVQLFMEEGGLTQQEACRWVAKRDVYLNNIVISPASYAEMEKCSQSA